MEDKLQKLNTFKSVSLSEEECHLLRAHGAHVMTTMIPVVTQSLFHRGVQHGLRIALSTFLFIVFVGSSVSVVANNALPGDPLYSFKLNVNEEIKGLFLKTTEEKVVWQKNRIESRVSEIKTLAESKTLTKAKQETVKRAIDGHVKALSSELSTLSDKEPNNALTVTASLEQSLKANKQAIANGINDSESKTDALNAVDGALKQVAKQEVKILSKEIDDITSDINMIVPPTPTKTTPVAP
jgi:hypothetical protein